MQYWVVSEDTEFSIRGRTIACIHQHATAQTRMSRFEKARVVKYCESRFITVRTKDDVVETDSTKEWYVLLQLS